MANDMSVSVDIVSLKCMRYVSWDRDQFAFQNTLHGQPTPTTYNFLSDQTLSVPLSSYGTDSSKLNHRTPPGSLNVTLSREFEFGMEHTPVQVGLWRVPLITYMGRGKSAPQGEMFLPCGNNTKDDDVIFCEGLKQTRKFSYILRVGFVFWDIYATQCVIDNVRCLTLNYHISKTAVPLHVADEMFNDAWVSALQRPDFWGSHHGVPRVPCPCRTSSPTLVEFGPCQSEAGPWEPFTSRP
ncbi:hypothetical protein F2P81_006382 [Scophthalmus maximus]|uniref:Uncharacterized protein n=1 Tax=Scophthalmus maximus TaxID=52904 RepID=A0A6A4TBF3_SCOMX|nr:hypothetical protein F2P81_006382 [Scophthalmus maximus]